MARSGNAAPMDTDRGADPTGATLDEEGIPDLQGPLPAKASTGDPQEGEPPPSSRPASREWGVTVAEARHGEPVSVRTAREQPDFGEPGALGEPDNAVVLVDQADEDIDGLDDEKDTVARAVDQSGLLVAPEDAAVHLVDDTDGDDALDEPVVIDGEPPDPGAG